MKREIKNICKIICMACYFVVAIILIVEACMPGDISANQSNHLGTIIVDKGTIDLGTKAEYINPQSINFDLDESQFYEGDSFVLKVIITPDNASKKIVDYTSSNTNVASVNQAGLLKCNNEGKTVIRAQIRDTSIFIEKEIQVCKPPLSNIKIHSELDEIMIGQSICLTATPDPSKAILGKISWNNSNNEVVSISDINQKKIQVTGLKVGSSVITAKNENGKEKKFEINVVEIGKTVDVVEITNDEKEVELVEGQAIQINFKYIPQDTTNPKFQMYSSNSLVATVSQDGKVVARNNGTAKIYVKYAFNQEINDYIVVNVKSRPANFKIKNEVNNDGYIEMNVNTSLDLILEKNSMPSAYKISYNVHNTDIAQISETGTINALGHGKTIVTITCQSGDGTKTTQKVSLNIIDEYSSNYSRFLLLVRKGIGHFLAFAVFAVVGAIFFIIYFKRKWIFLPTSLVIGFAIAGITEWIQTKVPGRYGAFTDVMIDFTGYFLGTILIFSIYGLCILIRFLLKNNKGGIKYEKK